MNASLQHSLKDQFFKIVIPTIEVTFHKHNKKGELNSSYFHLNFCLCEQMCLIYSDNFIILRYVKMVQESFHSFILYRYPNKMGGERAEKDGWLNL